MDKQRLQEKKAKLLEWLAKIFFFGSELAEPTKVHHIKCSPETYEDVVEGFPTFLILKNDKGYEPGDYLVLKEYDAEVEALTGRAVRTDIICIEDEHEGLKPGYCVIAIEES